MEDQLKERMKKAEDRFNELTKQKEDIDLELHKLQGEYRLASELLAKKEEKVEPKEKTNVKNS